MAELMGYHQGSAISYHIAWAQPVACSEVLLMTVKSKLSSSTPDSWMRSMTILSPTLRSSKSNVENEVMGTISTPPPRDELRGDGSVGPQHDGVAGLGGLGPADGA